MSLPRCLVVEPDPTFAYVLAGIISRHGFDVAIAREAFAALQTLRSESFDLVLYDVTSEEVDHDFILDTMRRELPVVLDHTVLVTTTPYDSSRLPAGVPVIGKNDLRPLLEYLTRE